MNIAHALFVPTGSIPKSGFLIAAVILIALGAASDVIALAMPALGPVLFFVGLVIIYCWVALWIKRFHEAGMSGWWTVLAALVWLIIESAVGFAIILGSGFDPSLFAGGDPDAIQAAMEPLVEAAAVPSLIASVVISAFIALGLNAILPAGKAASRESVASPEDPAESAGARSDG